MGKQGRVTWASGCLYVMVMAAVAVESPPVLAQTAPDAGRLLQEQPKPALVPAPKFKPAPAAPPEAAPDETGPRIQVKAVRVKGSKLIAEAELVAQLRALVGQELSFGQLQAAALRLIGYYASEGYIARVFLPPQDIKDGVVEYQVVEGTRGKLSVVNQGTRISTERVRGFIEQRIVQGAPMSLAALGEALNILNEQPGADVKSALAPGEGESAIDVNVTAGDRPLLSYNLGANNHGSRGTGVYQVTGALSLNNPSGRFDAASLLVNVSEGSQFARGDYSLAVGNSGLRAGVYASYLDYRLVQKSFSALSAEGTAETFGLSMSYPLRRLTVLNLSLTGNLDHKRLTDRTVAGETGNRVVKVANVGLSGFTTLSEDALSGLLSFGANLTAGDSDQQNAAALAADQAGRRTQGSFMKLGYNLGYINALSDHWTLSASLRGQRAQKNLESSERFSLGGVSGVRAYPTSEGFGDEGWLTNVNFIYRVSEQLNASVFVDSGEITVNHTIPAGGTATPNRYTLSGAGLSLDWRVRSTATLGMVLAAPLGNNPARDAAGNNNDGRPNKPRLWVNFSAQF